MGFQGILLTPSHLRDLGDRRFEKNVAAFFQIAPKKRSRDDIRISAFLTILNSIWVTYKLPTMFIGCFEQLVNFSRYKSLVIGQIWIWL